MGFFSGLWNGVKSVASSAWEATKSVASTVWETAKDVAYKTASWMADKAETFVKSVKSVWEATKPFIEKAIPWVNKLADYVPWPWAKTALKAVAIGLKYLTDIDKTLGDKVNKAVEWAIAAAKKVKEIFLSKREQDEAEARQRELQRAAEMMKTEEQRQAIRFAQVINSYVLVQSQIKEILDANNVQNFEHYLRLRATQKLLREAEKVLQKAQNIEEISVDDLFLIETGTNLLKADPTLSEADALRLDKIIRRRFGGKSLMPFVFEELVIAWEVRLKNMENHWEQLNKEAARLKREVSQLDIKGKITPLTSAETEQLTQLRIDLKDATHQMKVQESDNRAMQNYVYAAEGFIQTLEKSEQDWIDEGREWVLSDVAEVGQLIIDCAQNSKPWEDLTEEQQSLIRDYANIFKKESQERAKKLVEVEV